MYHDVVIAGFGGQGVLFMGNLLAEAGMEEGLTLPSCRPTVSR